MPETVRRFCPACYQEVDYEIDHELGDKEFCSICGRTQEIAEKEAKTLRKKNVRLKIRLALKVLAGVVILILLGFGLLIDPERVMGRGVSVLKSTLVLSIPVAIIFVIIYLIVRLVRRSRMKDDSRVRGGPLGRFWAGRPISSRALFAGTIFWAVCVLAFVILFKPYDDLRDEFAHMIAVIIVPPALAWFGRLLWRKVVAPE